ncbi:hypothetical protein EDC55_10843 [Allofrancisella inopinata]|uniref:Uncharacterized protein n=1 Tax=Allofrancisella inopinata TaxID=1085647 RepID=A0AAE6YH90_9GAMM|nr:hypothetical protein [Allofrancisella inopinata]QIV95693.1 hypothetical protein E4K63_02140 [Allofrancisella inopinata]TDT72150.1 hypothetical protein EDC55_10843 [Allofrancisella inopinata]
MSENQKDEYIEISITDLLIKLWRNKLIFVAVLVIGLIASSLFIANKNYNKYTYTATISLPINSGGMVLVDSKDIQQIFSDYNAGVGDLLGFVVNTSNKYIFDVSYTSSNLVERKVLDMKVNDFAKFLNNSDVLLRAKMQYVLSLDSADQHIAFLTDKLKTLKAKDSTESVGLVTLQDKLIEYDFLKQQAELNLKKADFVVNETYLDYSIQSKNKYILIALVLSLILSVFSTLGVDYIREKFFRKK